MNQSRKFKLLVMGIVTCNLVIMAAILGIQLMSTDAKATILNDATKEPVLSSDEETEEGASDSSQMQTEMDVVAESTQLPDQLYNDELVEGKTYTYFWRTYSDGTSTEPKEKDFSKDEAIEKMLEWLTTVYGFKYNDEQLTLFYETASESGMYNDDHYILYVEDTKTSSDKTSYYYEILINSVTGEMLYSQKYVADDTTTNGQEYHDLIADEEEETKDQSSEKNEVESYKTLALNMLKEYGIYDTTKLTYVSYEQDDYGYNIVYQTEEQSQLKVTISEESKEFVAYHFYEKELY